MSEHKDITWLNPGKSDLLKTEKRKIGSQFVDVSLSPFDIPDGVRAYEDQSREVCVIEFRYSTPPEPLRDISLNNEISLEIGKYSKRLYRIVLNGAIDRADVHGSLIKMLNTALASLSEQSSSWRETANYDVAKDIIERREKELFSKVRHAC